MTVLNVVITLQFAKLVPYSTMLGPRITHWKAPIAYYLTKCLSPGTQEVQLVHAFKELHACGIRVVCVTMDGHASNVHMCNQLGCQLKGNPVELLQTFFPHPVTGARVFVTMDACSHVEAGTEYAAGLQFINQHWRPDQLGIHC